MLSQEQIAQRRFQARAARATARAQAAALADLQTRAAKLPVAAPVSGLILEKTVRPGDLVGRRQRRPGSASPATARSSCRRSCREDDLARIRPGQHAQVTLPGGATVDGPSCA